MRGSALVVAVLALCNTAYAQRRGYQDGFLGWSKDGTFFAMTTSGTDEMDIPLLCLSKRGVASPTWPKAVPVPDPEDPDGCTERWDVMLPDTTTDAQQLVAQVEAMVESPTTGKKGPHGETVKVKRLRGPIIEVAVLRAGKRVARGFFEMRVADAAVPSQITVHWRADGGAVAVVAGYKPDPESQGYGAARYTVVTRLDGSTSNLDPPRTRHQRAEALNVAGLKLLTAKKLDDAQRTFEEAVDLDDEYALASYNLARAASLRHDKQASLNALRHLRILAGSDDPVAKKALAKGLTDHDLDFIATDPEGAKLLTPVSRPSRSSATPSSSARTR